MLKNTSLILKGVGGTFVILSLFLSWTAGPGSPPSIFSMFSYYGLTADEAAISFVLGLLLYLLWWSLVATDALNTGLFQPQVVGLGIYLGMLGFVIALAGSLLDKL